MGEVGKTHMDDSPKLHAAFRVMTALFTISVILGLLAAWYWHRSRELARLMEAAQDPGSGFVFSLAQRGNVIRNLYPAVDFSRLYPEMDPDDIDTLQRDSFKVRYLYSAFNQFDPMPLKTKFFEITEHGFRTGASEQPWPPSESDLVVFVFGGSTTFGYGVPSENTVVSAIEAELNDLIQDRNVRAYNFGRGYYIATQERILFEKMLLDGYVPDVAIFIDGLNDYYYADGEPALSTRLYRYTAPDLPAPPPLSLDSDAEKQVAVDRILDRYTQNARMLQAIAREYGITPLFVGQPVPFLDYPINENTYPFGSNLAGHELCVWGYSQFKQRAADGDFGPSFVWLGDLFAAVDTPMYVDTVHYSFTGSALLGEAIAVECAKRMSEESSQDVH